jgi:tRNA pseudouridine13 synthase
MLQERVAAGTWNQLLVGDIASLAGSNSVFAVDALDEDLRRRCKELDVHPSAALWGRASDAIGMRLLPWEREAVAAHQEFCSGLERLCEASRRPLRAAVSDLQWHIDGASLHVEFSLPRGSFATAVLREVADYHDRSIAAR